MTQRLSSFDGIDADRIQELVRLARRTIPFYRDHLQETLESVQCLKFLPTFEKSNIAGYGRFPLSIGGASGAYRVTATSGTSGARFYVAWGETEWDRTARWLERVGRRVGLTSADVLLNTHCYGLWVGGPALDLLAHRIGAGLVPLGPADPSVVLRLLAEGVGTAIAATPSYLRRLIEAAQTARIDLTKTSLRFGFIGAEMAEESLRRKLLQDLPADFRWIELYGLTETGGPAVAFAPNPAMPTLELNIDDFAVEVLDPIKDRFVRGGEVGEVTVTTRRIVGRTLLIRYRTRDLAIVAAGDSEAPTHISRILGRADDSVKVGGVLVYPSAIAEIVSDLLPATAEWQASVNLRPEKELCIEAEAGLDQCQRLEQAFQERVGISVIVRPAPPGSLKRSRHKTRRTTQLLVDSVIARGLAFAKPDGPQSEGEI